MPHGRYLGLPSRQIGRLFFWFFLIFIITTGTAQTQAAAGENTWYVRPAGGTYGLEDGTSYADAWDGFANIDWSVLGAGDTLYLIGTFTNHLAVYSGGDATGDLWIRGDHALGAGILNNSYIVWTDSNSNYITVYGVTINEGRITYTTAAGYNTGTNLLFVAPNIIRDPDKGFRSSNLQPGQMISITGGSRSSNNGWSHLIKSITDKGDYEEIILETEEAIRSIVAEGPGPKTLEAFWPSHHLTIDNSYIQSSQDWSLVVDIKGTDITIRNSELDGSGTRNRGGVLYTSGRDFWKLHANITIEGNYIHGGSGGSITSTADEHCIGIQGTDGLLITRNRIADCGSGIVMWHGGNTAIKNYEITYNLIEGMDYNVSPGQWGGSAIVYTGNGTGPPDNTEGLVAGNVIRNPLNCPQGGENEWGACLGIRTKVEKTMRIYNNLIIGYDYGIKVENFVGGDVKNNIVRDSGLRHVFSEPPGNFYEEDYNIYYPDSSTSFGYLHTITNLSDYNDNHAVHAVVVNQNSLIADPELNGAYQPSSLSSPAVNAGVNVGYQYLVSATWPTGPGGGTFVFGDDSASPDIGPFMFVGLVFVGKMVTGDMDGDGKAEVIIDFGPSFGIWVRKNDSIWVQLVDLSPEAMVTGDMDGDGKDEVIIDFGPSFGIWVRKNDSIWVQWHSLSPEAMVTGDMDGDGKDEVIIDFGPSFGISVRKNDSIWVPLHSLSPEAMVTGNVDGT